MGLFSDKENYSFFSFPGGKSVALLPLLAAGPLTGAAIMVALALTDAHQAIGGRYLPGFAAGRQVNSPCGIAFLMIGPALGLPIVLPLAGFACWMRWTTCDRSSSESLFDRGFRFACVRLIFGRRP